MTYSSKTPCPDRVLPSTTVWFFQRVFTLHTSHFTLHSSHSKLETSHSTLHTSHFALHSPHFTLLTSHCFLHTPNLTLHTSHCALRTPNLNFTLHTSHFPLLPSHFTLHTALFTPQHHLQSYLHCGNDPTVANHNGILSTANARNTGDTPFTMRNRSETDPTMIRPHTRPSPTRRTAEVDHRRSGTHFVWKNTGFRASAISQKRISCETSFKTPSATPPPAPLAIPFTVRERSYTVANHNGIPSATHPPVPLAILFTLRERSYSCKSQWNSVDRKCTKHRWHPIYNAEPIRDRSAHDPTTHETVSHPSHRRGRSSTFGDALCLEKHRVSCICYLSKTHFVRDFLQNSIGNSSTSTTCNPIYIAGTILQLQITMEFCRPQMHETQVTRHLQCGTDPRSIRPWSDQTRDRLAPVAPQR